MSTTQAAGPAFWTLVVSRRHGNGRTGLGTGLQGMADRLEALGGRLEITSAPGRGTTVVGRIPVHQGDPT